jgi:hypothetical protein
VRVVAVDVVDDVEELPELPVERDFADFDRDGLR